MSLYEFSALSQNEQAEATWNGEFFMTREDHQHVILLYKVHSFYVEVFYNNMTNKIVRFNPFNSKKRLNLYFSVQLN